MSQSFTVTLNDDEVTAATQIATQQGDANLDAYVQNLATKAADADVVEVRGTLTAKVAASMNAMTLAELIAFAATMPAPVA